MSVAAAVRERSRREATSRSSRDPLGSLMTNWCSPGAGPLGAPPVIPEAASGSLGRAGDVRRGPSGPRTILGPKRPCEHEGTHAYRHVRDVERRPPVNADADVDEINDAHGMSNPVDHVADRARTHQPDRGDANPVVGGRLAIEPPENDERDDRQREKEPP